MSAHVVERDGITIWTERFGDPSATPILLIAGANASSRMWPDELVTRLADAGHLVVRYDHRDTGRSTTLDFTRHPYSVADLTGEAVAVLDAYGISRAHVVGFSLGGTIAQVLALDWPHRLLSVTAMCTSALDVDFGANFRRALEGIPAAHDSLPTPDPVVVHQLMRRNAAITVEAELERRVEVARALAGGTPVDADEVIRRESAAIAHAGTHRSPIQHTLADPIPVSRGAELANVRTRTLVVQGGRDPLNPPPHGQHLADLVPGARLVELADLGHNLPGPLLDDVEAVLLEHFAGSGTRPGLAAELIDLAGEQERAIAAFTARAIDDPTFGERVRDRLGWHPTDDPAAVWARSGRAPAPPWLVRWDERETEVLALLAAVTRGTQALARALDEHGWPSRALVGEDGADAAWMLAMHADTNPLLQQRCLELLEKAVATNDADPRHQATLADRLAANRGEQRYGTLVLPAPTTPQPLVPIVDPDSLDRRRAAIGLPPLADDLAADPGQLPYRHLRRTEGFRWPPRRR